MRVITADKVSRWYKVPQKEEGWGGRSRSFFWRRYKEIKAVDEVSFSVEKGELIGFIGPNGAGKTTTLKMLSGLLYPSAGEVRVLGFNPFERKREFLGRISLVMGQKNQLWWDLPASDSFKLNKEIYQIPEDEYRKTLDELTEILEVGDILETAVRKLSLGQRMKMELIAALLHKPEILFLDEPTIGLDVVVQQKMREFIREYNRRYEATILLTSHYMADVKELCKRVVVIDKGQILFDGELLAIVKKHAPNKMITVELEKEMAREKLEKFGAIKRYEYPVVEFSVQRETAMTVAAEILGKLPVVDLNIEEPKIEDIIRALFSGKE